MVRTQGFLVPDEPMPSLSPSLPPPPNFPFCEMDIIKPTAPGRRRKASQLSLLFLSVIRRPLGACVSSL